MLKLYLQVRNMHNNLHTYLKRSVNLIYTKHQGNKDRLVKEISNLASIEGRNSFTEFLETKELASGNLSQLQQEYRQYFTDKLHSYNVLSPAELTREQKIDFFNSIADEWINGVGER